MDLHIEKIFPDDVLWSEMIEKLSHFYRTTLGVEVLARLYSMYASIVVCMYVII